MPKPDQPLLQEAQHYVKNIYATRINENFVFHNLEHTKYVVRCCEMIANHYRLSDEDLLVLLISAWFHDTGYASGEAKQHEDEGQKMASEFLRSKNVDDSLLDAVNACIMATKMPQSPSNLVEQIMCDADLYHLGTEAFEEKTKLLRQEVNFLQEESVGKKEWRQINIEFLQRHRYFTDYCREKLEPVKQQNLEALLNKQGRKEKMASAEKETEAGILVAPVDPVTAATLESEREKEEDIQEHIQEQEEKQAEANQEDKEEDKEEKDKKNKEKDKKEKEKQSRTERGVVAMFRIMSENHISLSQMADNKANIMISVNTIVISIMVALLLGKLQFYPEYVIPTVILVTICLLAVVFAILATRPNVSGGTFTKEDIANKKINLLFFGNFYKMELDDYDWAMKEMMTDKEYLFGSMIKDLYFLGVVLARKYKLLRISYNIFMYGLIGAIVTFVIAFFLSGQNNTTAP